METRPLTVLGILLTLAVAVILSSPSLAKPKLDKLGNCQIPVQCTTNSIDAGCAELYCRSLRAKCNGDYSSGECRDIKELHGIAMCSVAKSSCGNTLPRILTFGALEIWLGDGEIFVTTDPDDDQVDFEAIFDDAAKILARAKEQASRPAIDPDKCLKMCLSKVSKESSAACSQICDPEQY